MYQYRNSLFARKKTILSLATLSCLLISGCQNSQADQAKGNAATDIGVITVNSRELTLNTELPGRTTAYQSALIRPQIGGIIQKRIFTEGGLVKAGDLLYEIDPSSYQATYNSALASVEKAKATLNAANLKATRQTELWAISATSKQDYEDAIATQQQAKADLAIAQASLETARINLAHTRITAPISGLIEISTVTPGALVTANQETALTTVQQLDPIYVDIPQSSAQVLQLRNAIANGQIHAVSSKEIPVQIKLEDGSTYKHAGKLLFTGSSVDTSTGTITLRALVPNPEHMLMPGMYVRAQLDQAVIKQAILVPQKAVARTNNGQATAQVVAASGKVELRNITVANAVGHDYYVTSGLAVGDKLVVEGSAKIRPGQMVHTSEISNTATTSSPAGAANTTTAK